ncbi:ABC transporter permease [Skermanella sp. TT6]|uniref:ABC transporter permease n=1 Tax=Skermanella cutis TaxID=2775420 RepID=A0ABX7BCR8_9PROT|nr:ABC transporter permease [Skermanella sp. TT6]QQP92181.1 ABC transporter permease [Skermanella sp. TT6]
MLSYALRRLAMIVPVLFGISVIVFLIMALIPGDPALAILGSFATPENVAGLRQELGLDRSLVEQYGIWLGNLLQGDFGRSYSLNRPVLDEIADRLGPTLLLAGASLVLCTVLGLAAGVVSAVRQYGWQDKILTLLVLVGLSTPSFWLGLILVLVFSVQLGWFPVSGMYAIYGGGDLADLLHHLALPAITLAVVATGVIARLTRSTMLEVLRQDFVRTARAKGLDEGMITYKHALRNALVNIVPVIGIQTGFVLGGAVYIETVFQWPGIGRMLVTAISTRDILLVQGGVLVVAACYVLINLAADLVQHMLDPRIGT